LASMCSFSYIVLWIHLVILSQASLLTLCYVLSQRNSVNYYDLICLLEANSF
jgi:hypothetical protein